MTVSDRSCVVITGAGGALGSAFIDHYLARSRRVIGLDISLPDTHASSDNLVLRRVDIASSDELHAILSETIDKKERIGILLNAAGLIWNESVVSLKDGRLSVHGLLSWRNAIEANLTAPFVAAAVVAERMARQGGGSIVNFSSISSVGNIGQSAYSAAKAGLEAATRVMAAELGPLGIRANAIALGFIDVGSTRKAVTEERLAEYLRRTPVGRLGAIDDVISAVEFLEQNSFINGEIVRVDGGLRL